MLVCLHQYLTHYIKVITCGDCYVEGKNIGLGSGTISLWYKGGRIKISSGGRGNCLEEESDGANDESGEGERAVKVQYSLEAGADEATEDDNMYFWGDFGVSIGVDWGVSLFMVY